MYPKQFKCIDFSRPVNGLTNFQMCIDIFNDW